MTRMPALSLAAVPGRRKATIELATEIEKRGFSGIYGPSLGDSLALCEALAFATNEITFGTSIMPIYFRQVVDYASTVSFPLVLSSNNSAKIPIIGAFFCLESSVQLRMLPAQTRLRARYAWHLCFRDTSSHTWRAELRERFFWSGESTRAQTRTLTQTILRIHFCCMLLGVCVCVGLQCLAEAFITGPDKFLWPTPSPLRCKIAIMLISNILMSKTTFSTGMGFVRVGSTPSQRCDPSMLHV